MKKFFIFLICLFTTLNIFAKPVETEEVFNISETTTLVFNKRLKTFSIYISNENRSIELFYGNKLSSVKYINNLILDAAFGKSKYYNVIDENKNICFFVIDNDETFYVLDKDLYKVKREILNTRIN